MTNIALAVVLTSTIMALFSRGFGVNVFSLRCARICEQKNGLSEHFKDLHGNTREIFSDKSAMQRDFITGRNCDCETFKKKILLRNRRLVDSIASATSTPPAENNMNPNSTSKPGKRHFVGQCYDPPDLSVNRTWKAHNLMHYRSTNETAHFMKNGSANVTWLPHSGNHNVYGYIVIWKISFQEIKCQEVVNRTHLLLGPSDGWNVNKETQLNIAVFSLPGYLDIPRNRRTIIYTEHFPPIGTVGPLVTFPTKKIPVEENWRTYLAGVLGGVLLIVLLLGAHYGRKAFRTPNGTNINPICAQENNHLEGFIQVNKSTKPQNDDVYFASYLPESEEFSNNVATIAYKLGTMGYKVVFDQVDSVHMNEIGFNMWVDKQILEAKKYIVFCSPGYVRLWQSLAKSTVDNRLNHVNKEDLVRVRYEIKRISDVYSENCSTSRIVCIKMDTKMTTKQLPPWMNHNMLLWPKQKEDVIRRLNDQAAMVMHV